MGCRAMRDFQVLWCGSFDGRVSPLVIHNTGEHAVDVQINAAVELVLLIVKPDRVVS